MSAIEAAPRVCLLFSGGLDSTMSALVLDSEGFDIIALTIDYPGRPVREKEIAFQIASQLPISSIISVSIECPDMLTIPSLRGTDLEGWIPFRNFMFWAIGANQAARVGARFVAAGHDDHDQEAFTDVSESFFESISNLMKTTGNSSYDGSLSIRLPLLSMTDQQLIELFNQESKAKILLSTWSCWRDVVSPCRVCAACRDRELFLDKVAASNGTHETIQYSKTSDTTVDK